jgi:IclR family KDG regulon transcriptional repressor
MPATEDRYVVTPVMKALRALDAVAASDEGSTLAALTAELRFPKTSLFRYLRTLVVAGYLDHDATTDTYRVGARFRSLHTPAPALERLRQAALPEMQALRREFDETVNLGVRQGPEIVYVDVVESERRLRILARIGSRDPLHSTALGKAILSRLPAAERQAVLAGRLRPRTKHTVVDRARLDADLLAAAQNGYAVEQGENEEGAVCISVALAPVMGIAAAISLSAPEGRLTADRFALIGEAIAASVCRINARLSDQAFHPAAWLSEPGSKRPHPPGGSVDGG